ncbi:uncharacterized protein AMSG_07840, partial [Thecamonas trahens ATCC 50062]
TTFADFMSAEGRRMFGEFHPIEFAPSAVEEVEALVNRAVVNFSSPGNGSVLDALSATLAEADRSEFVADAFLASVDKAEIDLPPPSMPTDDGSAAKSAGDLGDLDVKMLAQVRTALAQSIIFSAASLMTDEWEGSPREGVVCSATHVLAGARENAWLNAWCRIGDDAYDKVDELANDDALTVATAELRERIVALEESLPDAIVHDMKPPKHSPAATDPPPASLAPASFLTARASSGVTQRELKALEAAVGFDLSPWLRAFYLARDGVSLAHLIVHPSWLLLNELMAHRRPQINYFSTLHAVPVRNPVAGGRWGEALDVALCTTDDNDVVVQVEHFFPPSDLTCLPASSLDETLTLVTAAAAAGRFTDRCYWNVKLEDRTKSKLADFGIPKKRLATIVWALEPM